MKFYPNGVSTSLPFHVQIALVRFLQGLENAHLTRAAYAIEYDYFDPRDLEDSLEINVSADYFLQDKSMAQRVTKKQRHKG